MSAEQPFWFEQALAQEPPQPPNVLQGKTNADVCIIGGGYTGLWTAIKLKQQAPEKDVVVIDKGLCGQGASGRNGGCMLTLSTKYATLARLFGQKEAIRLVKASDQAVYDIADFCLKHNIDAEIRLDGALYTATNSIQKANLHKPLASLKLAGINQWQSKGDDFVQQYSGSTFNQQGIFSAAAGSLQPGKLVRGLARVARQLGVRIFENTPMTTIDYGKIVKVTTAKGEIKTPRLVLAMNAWMAQTFKTFRRSIVLVSSDMLITKPMPDELAAMNFNHGMVVADSRIFVHYYRSTPDGRLMLGKGGNLFSYGNKMLAAFDQPSAYQKMLQNSFQRFFPSLPHHFERSWTGASDRSVTGVPFFGRFEGQSNVFYGLGYSGNGVVQSYLGGDILSSLVLDKDNEWTRSGMSQGCRGHFPIEPFRTLGAQIVRNSVLRKESMEDNEQQAYWLDTQLAKLASAAGKADK
ncbi:FAD-dependent oxidoreductase [Colwellia sp. 39_35_sub15_T18]|nr:FAD-dependent oxidoreductase [Colwellia sp. 39_35_sub15_T18]